MFVAATGVALTTVARLGTTPISTVPYVITALTGLSFGTTTFLLSLLMVAGQALVLRRRFNLMNLLQIPTVFFFGAFIDLAMHLVSPHPPSGWWTGLAMSMAGNVVLAAGIVMQIRSKTLVQPGEGLVLAVAAVTKRPFGTIKILNDVTFSALAVAIGLCAAGEVIGVREGTVISAVLVGLFARLIGRLFPDRPAEGAGLPEPHEVPVREGDDPEAEDFRAGTPRRPVGPGTRTEVRRAPVPQNAASAAAAANAEDEAKAG